MRITITLFLLAMGLLVSALSSSFRWDFLYGWTDLLAPMSAATVYTLFMCWVGAAPHRKTQVSYADLRRVWTSSRT